MRRTILLSALFLYTLAGAFLLFSAGRVYGQWTGGFALWPIVLPALIAGWVVGWALRRWAERRVGPRLLGAAALAVALASAFAFLLPAEAVRSWTLLSMRIGLTYEAWRGFVWGRAVLWFVPLAFLLPLLWVRGSAIAERGRLTVFVGVCVGFILGRIFVGHLPTFHLWTACVAALLLAGGVWLVAAFGRLWARILAALTGAACLCGSFVLWAVGFSAADPLREVNPFAVIAARDVGYTGTGTEGFTLLEGRVVQAEDQDTAARAAAQFIPALLKPAPNARIAVRPIAAEPLLPAYEAGKLKGLYDAIWVELPPAWMPEEQDFFRAAALSAVLGNLQESGILVYALDARALDARMVMERVAVLRNHFEFVQVWMTGPNDWQLVASRKPITANLEELLALYDRPEVAEALLRVRLGAPVTLLPCCLAADARTLEAALAEPIKPRLPRREHLRARRLLFDREGGRRLLAAFAPLYDVEMPWVTVPSEAEAEFRELLGALRVARRQALEGKFAEAGRLNPLDPFLQSLAERELGVARAFEKLADTENALKAYNSAFALALPRLSDVLGAAELAKSTGQAERAEPYFRLAGSLAPEDPDYLSAYAAFLLEGKRFAEAERAATQALRQAAEADPARLARLRFLVATCVARQAGREAEGLALARRVAAEATAQQDKDTYIPAYGQLLIDAGRAKAGLAVKFHYQAYGTLLPQAQEAKP